MRLRFAAHCTPIKRSYIWSDSTPGPGLHRVPASRADIFRDRSLVREYAVVALHVQVGRWEHTLACFEVIKI